MFSHIMVGSNDIARSKKFYDATFAALGVGEGRQSEKQVTYNSPQGSYMVTIPLDGNPATYANGGTIGFKADSAEQAKAWHDAGIASGGTTCEDPPGFRENPYGKLYLAYLRDPDGNKLCAGWFSA